MSNSLEKKHLNLAQAVGRFDELYDVFYEFFGHASDDILREYIDNIFKVESSSNDNLKSLIFTEQKITKKLFPVFGNIENQKIINALKIPHTAYTTCVKTGIPRSTFYRKLSSMSKIGVVFMSGFETNHLGPTKIYESLFDDVEFNTSDKDTTMRATIPEKTYNQSIITSRLKI